MIFNGSIIKNKAKESGLTLLRLAQAVNVSRQTVNSWIGGSVPRGQHLVKLCSLLNVKPGDFFAEPTISLMSVPLHRTIRNKAVTTPMREASQNLAEQYINFFRQAPTVSVLPVVRVQKRTPENAKVIAERLRKLSGEDEGKPMGYESAFRLLAELGIYVVFRSFPKALEKNSYAFYSRIAGQRIVFVNIDTNVLDLIFQLLHETVHAVRDEEPGAIDIKEEEEFCDMVAELTQFQDFYVDMVARSFAKTTKPAIIINHLKEVSKEYAHSLWGVYYRLKRKGLVPEDLNVGGAATNLNKNFPSLRDVLFSKNEHRHYVDMLYGFSPNFMNLVEDQVPDCSLRKLGEWLGLSSSIDAKVVMDEIAWRKAQA